MSNIRVIFLKCNAHLLIIVYYRYNKHILYSDVWIDIYMLLIYMYKI